MLEVPPLENRVIHLWFADLDPPAGRVPEHIAVLSPSERRRADRFRFDWHRRRFHVRRGQLRHLLGAYLGRPPAEIEFSYGEHGKPVVDGLAGAAGACLHFNLSDSEDLAAYAVTLDSEVGVDVEILRPMPDALPISERFFSEAEREVLRAVDPALTERAFFNCWTRKEAYLKAIGKGLAQPLSSFAVTLEPGAEPRFLHFDNLADEVAHWDLFHFHPTSESVGALAIRQRGWTIRSCGWLP